MIWTAVAGATVFLIAQYNYIYRTQGPGTSRQLIAADAAMLFFGPIALAIWLAIDLHWRALLFILIIVLAPILSPFTRPADPLLVHKLRLPLGIAGAGAIVALWLFSSHGLELGKASGSYSSAYSAPPPSSENMAADTMYDANATDMSMDTNFATPVGPAQRNNEDQLTNLLAGLNDHHDRAPAANIVTPDTRPGASNSNAFGYVRHRSIEEFENSPPARNDLSDGNMTR